MVSSGVFGHGIGFPPQQKVVDCRRDEERYDGGVNHPAENDDGHGLNDFGTHAESKGQRYHGQNGSGRRHHDGTHTGTAAFDQRFGQGFPRFPQAVDVIDQHDAVVDDDPAQQQEAHNGDDADITAADQQSKETAGKGQRYGDHDDHRRQQ